MAAILHAHEVLNLVQEHPGKYTVDTLKSEVIQKFGTDVRFNNCHGYLFNFDELIYFFQNRRKIQILENAIHPVPENICQH